MWVLIRNASVMLEVPHIKFCAEIRKIYIMVFCLSGALQCATLSNLYIMQVILNSSFYIFVVENKVNT